MYKHLFNYFCFLNSLKMKIKIFPLAIVSFAAALWSCETANNKQVNQESGTAKTLVEVIVVTKGNLAEKLETTGNLLANESTQLSTEAAGIVSKIYFKEGSKVEQGKLLLELNNADLKAELEMARVKMNLAEKQFKRSQKLLAAEGLSEEAFEKAESTYRESAANYEMVKAELIKTQVRAPFSGQIGLRSISEGDYLATNSSFADLVDISPLKIQFDLPEQYINTLKEGDSISFSSAISSQPRKAVIYALEPQINPNSRTFSAKASFANKDQQLKAGGFVRVTYRATDLSSSLLIPNQAIVPELEGKKVFLVKNGKAVIRKVTTGIRNADRIQVLTGLEAGDTIVTTGLLQIRDGVPLQLRMDDSFGSKATSKK